MKKIIASDCDGVLLNWLDSFRQFMENSGYRLDNRYSHEYNIDRQYGLKPSQAYSLISDFNHSDYIKSLKPFADSVEYVRRLHEKGFTFMVISSVSAHPTTALNRFENLTSVFGDVFDSVHCISQGESKYKALCEKIDPDTFWIEDHMRQAEAGLDARLRPILIDHPHNRHFSTDLFPRVSHTTPWKEIYDIICKEYSL